MLTATEGVMVEVAVRPAEQPLQFVEPLPGFDHEQRYTFTPIDEHGLLFSLRSVSDPGLRFVLTQAHSFFDDYAPQLTPEVGESLGAADDVDGELDVLVMLTISTGLLEATANLRAPIVVCASTGRALQVVLEDDSLPMQRRLVEPAAALKDAPAH